MQRLPPWLVSMFAGLFGAALLGALGAPSLVALLGGVAVGFVAHRSRRDPPWTAAGRRRWREGWHRGRLGAGSIGRAWQAYASRRRDPFGPGGGGRAAPPHGWPGGPGSVVTGAAPSAPEPPEHAEPRTQVTVRCEVVTARFQVWHSTDTGRAYEVPVERGLAGAAPGSIGTLTFDRGRARVVRRTVN